MAANIRVEGAQEIIKQLKNYGKDVEDKIESITAITAQEIATDAASNAPANYGKLRQSINASKEGKMLYNVNVNAVPIGAYVEFGTGAKVDVPDEWKDLAWQFYVNGKGYLPPTPYLYPAFRKGRAQYEKDLQNLLDKLSSSFNK
jgi:HK97 gp10 family phage protein